jgi:hypothetical protein
MKKHHTEQPSPFQNLENHFLNVFHAGVYLSGQEMVDIAKKFNYDIPLKNRELVIKNLLNTANDENNLPAVVLELSHLIQNRIKTLNALALDYPNAAAYLQTMIQRSASSDKLLKQQQRSNPYE